MVQENPCIFRIDTLEFHNRQWMCTSLGNSVGFRDSDLMLVILLKLPHGLSPEQASGIPYFYMLCVQGLIKLSLYYFYT